MQRRFVITALGSLLCLPLAAQRPTADQQKATLDRTREIAAHYTAKLPDFICTEQVERTDYTGPKNNKMDRLTIQLNFSGQKEDYKLVAMNGSKTDQKLESLDGLITGGEFGSLLAGIFDPAAAAAFDWKENTTLRKHQAAVYTYRIGRAKSHYFLGRRAADGSMSAAAAGYHGEVVIDNQTSHVLRLTASADDIPKDSGILQSSIEVDYDFIEVAGHSYLLPAHSNAHMERSYRQIGNVVSFANYRKFEADSTIDFHPAE